MTDPDDFVVWIIDDDAAVRESLAALLEVSSYQVVTCASAEAYLAQPSHLVGCLLLDLHMPGMGGLELLQVIAHQAPHRPVLILSASRDEHLRQRALALGARAFLSKPVPYRALLDALQAARAGA